ncbi:unnamed protein product, partial [Musa banksii]
FPPPSSPRLATLPSPSARNHVVRACGCRLLGVAAETAGSSLLHAVPAPAAALPADLPGVHDGFRLVSPEVGRTSVSRC